MWAGCGVCGGAGLSGCGRSAGQGGRAAGGQAGDSTCTAPDRTSPSPHRDRHSPSCLSPLRDLQTHTG